jgi:uroporphyrinogen-III synthase
MTGKLDGLTVLVPESRELDLFAGMLEAEGAVALRCPLVLIRDLEDSKDADRWLADFIAMPFDDLILLTGEGLRRLVDLSERLERKDAFLAALAKTRTITRGPKPNRALHELQLTAGLSASQPTSQGVLDALAKEEIKDRRIGVQLYPGDGAKFLLDGLAACGAKLFPVTPYRYASQTEAAQVASTIHAMASGHIGMIAFTSTPQIGRLLAVAQECGLERELAEGLAKTPIASIGPVVEEALKKIGVTPAVQPVGSYHLKPLVRAIIASRGQRAS